MLRPEVGEDVSLAAARVEPPVPKKLFRFLRYVLCEIAEYPEKGAEAMLRSRIQFLTGHQFIFAGSRQHLMSEMFVSAKRPFYHSTQTVAIGPIDRDRYFEFASRHFGRAGMTLDMKTFASVYDRFNGVTWYVQAVMNRLYALGVGKPTPDDAILSITQRKPSALRCRGEIRCISMGWQWRRFAF